MIRNGAPPLTIEADFAISYSVDDSCIDSFHEQSFAHSLFFTVNICGDEGCSSQEVYKPDGVTLVQQSQWQYDLAGRMQRATDGVGNYTDFTYNGAGQSLSSSTYNAGGTPAASSAQEFDISGRLVQSTDGTDNYTRFVYNGAGQIVEELAYDPLDVLLTTKQRDYDLAGRLREMVDAEGNITRLIYNGLGQTVSTKIYKPNGADLVYEHTAVYDSAGRLKET